MKKRFNKTDFWDMVFTIYCCFVIICGTSIIVMLAILIFKELFLK